MTWNLGVMMIQWIHDITTWSLKIIVKLRKLANRVLIHLGSNISVAQENIASSLSA